MEISDHRIGFNGCRMELSEKAVYVSLVFRTSATFSFKLLECTSRPEIFPEKPWISAIVAKLLPRDADKDPRETHERNNLVGRSESIKILMTKTLHYLCIFKSAPTRT